MKRSQTGFCKNVVQVAPLALALLLTSCSSSMPRAFKVTYKNDNVLYAGATKVDITPVPYGEDGSCPEGKYCFEVPVQWEYSDGCTQNSNRVYEGYLNKPDGDKDKCLEGFIDANGNGWFDAIWLGGFNMARPATGVDPDAHIYARIFSLKFNNEAIVVVVLDNIGFPTVQLAGLRERLKGLSGGTLKKKSILLFSVHNHESPDTQGLWGPDLVSNYPIEVVEGLNLRDILKLPFLEDVDVQFPTKGLVDPYWAWVENRVIEGVAQAFEHMKPAQVIPFSIEVPHKEIGCHTISTEGDVKIDCNNNGIYNEKGDLDIFESGMKNGYAGCFTDPAVPVRYLITDSRFPYVVDYNVYGYQFRDTSGKAIVTFVVWGNHVEVMSDDNTAISGDWAGYMCNALEKKFGGTCVFQIAPEGGLTTPLGTCIPYIDDNGNYISQSGESVTQPTTHPDDFLKLFYDDGIPLKPAVTAFERAKSLGRQIAKSVEYAIEQSEVYEAVSLKNTLSFVNIPLYNPLFYVAGRLELLEGLSLLIMEDVDTEKIDDVIWKKELSPENNACGPVMCLRLPINLVQIDLKNNSGTIKTGFITNPGELLPDFVVGRKAGTMYFRDAPSKISEVSKDPNFPSFRYTTYINPITFNEIKGLREVAKDNGYSLFFVLAEGNSSIGYELPWEDFILVYEGVFKDIRDYASIIDSILDNNDNDPEGNSGLYHFFKLTENDKYLTFKKLMDDTWKLFKTEVNDYNPPDGTVVYLADHPNIYEEEVSMGPFTGNIVYNMLRSMIEGKSSYTSYRALPGEDQSAVDPNLNPEVKALPKLKE